MRVEVAVEERELAAADGAGLVAHHGAMPGVEIAHRERGELGGDEPRQARDAAAREVVALHAAVADGVQRVEGPLDRRVGQHGAHRAPGPGCLSTY